MSETVVTGVSDEGFLEKSDADLIHEAELHSEDIRRLFTSKEYTATRAALARLLSKSPFRQQEYAIDQVAKADSNNIQEVAASQLAIVNSYYQSGLQQSQQSFYWSLIWGGIGFGFLIVAVVVLLVQQPTSVAVMSGIAGVLVEVFAGTYLYLYKHASDQLARFRESLDRTQWLLLANSMCEQLEGEMKQTARIELIQQIGAAIVNGQAFKKPEKEQ